MRKLFTLLFLLLIASWSVIGSVLGSYSFASAIGNNTSIVRGTNQQTSFWDEATVSAAAGFNNNIEVNSKQSKCLIANGLQGISTNIIGCKPISNTTTGRIMPFVRNCQNMNSAGNYNYLSTGTISGVVTDGVTNEAIANGIVKVLPDGETTTTNDNGEYTLALQAGSYDLEFSQVGYQTVVVTGNVVITGVVSTVNAQLFEQPYAPGCASATVSTGDTQCEVNWCGPSVQYMIVYDDGDAENYTAWQLAGNLNAVKFTPIGYPSTVTGARIFIGDGSYPAGGNVIGSSFYIKVFSANSNGLPDVLLDSVGPLYVNNTGWIDIGGLYAIINSGDFFIALEQGTNAPDCIPLGVDETLPKAFKSYSRNVVVGGNWVVSPFQDFMIRAILESRIVADDSQSEIVKITPGKVPGLTSQKPTLANSGTTGLAPLIKSVAGFEATETVVSYSLSRIFLGISNPVAPTAGVSTLITPNLITNTYIESGSTWTNLQQGWYAYGIAANYPNGQQSDIVYTNTVAHKMFANLTVNVKLACGLTPAEDAVLTLTGQEYPFEVYTATVPASGSVVIENVIKGQYNLMIHKQGYYDFSMEVNIQANHSVDAVLEDIRYVPRNLSVDCGTLVATWDEPLSIILDENFEAGVFPPAGWQATTQGSTGWYATIYGSCCYNNIIPAHTTYALSNDDQSGQNNNGCCDLLITPELDLTNAPQYVLSFESYYDGSYGQLAFIELSTDNGYSWTPIYTCKPDLGWHKDEVDLSAFSGKTGLSSVWFAFHADDAGQWASIWAVDDISIISGGIPHQGYGVFINGALVDETSEHTYTFDPNTITYGQTYVAGVAGKYCSGWSDLDTNTFTSCFLYPPDNLEATAISSTTSSEIYLTWDTPVSGDSLLGEMASQNNTVDNQTGATTLVPHIEGNAPANTNLLGYNLYRDNSVVAFIEKPETEYWDLGLLPGTYCYDITSVYDLEPYGFPAGTTGESVKEGTACVELLYGLPLPFLEDWTTGQFDVNLWTTGQNWILDEQEGNPAPAAKFKRDPELSDYSESLESYYILGSSVQSTTYYRIYLDFDLKLDDIAASGNEKLIVEIWDGATWTTLKEYANIGDFDWIKEQIDISAQAKHTAFKLRFRALGASSSDINFWAIDNIKVYPFFILYPPRNLFLTLQGTPPNDAKLTWNAPEGGGTVMTYIIDDGTAENGWAINPSSEAWLGNEFAVSEEGILQSLDLYWMANVSAGNDLITADIFDASQAIVGSTEPFAPVDDAWQTVALPDVPYSGTFYVMLHWNNFAGNTNYLGSDEDGPHAADNYGWYYDGAAWAHLSDYGYAPNVFTIRAKALIDDNKSTVIYNASSPIVSGKAGTMQAIKADKSANTGNNAQSSAVLRDGSKSLIGYQVERRNYTSYPIGPNVNGQGIWDSIAGTTTTDYLDLNVNYLFHNCYEYRVIAKYDEGVSIPSNIDFDCIGAVSNYDDAIHITIYPNPSTTYVRISFDNAINTMEVFNSLGVLVAYQNVENQSFLTLNTSNYTAGTYNARFITKNGEVLNRRFVVTK